MAILRKIGRWTAGRLQGTKGTRKYDDWMKRNPWASTALGAGDLALAFYTPSLLKGAGSYLTKAPAGSLRSGAGNLLQRGGQFLRGTPGTAAAEGVEAVAATPNILERGVDVAGRAGRYMLNPKNAAVTGQILLGAERAYTNAADRARQIELENEQRRINRRAAEYLMPMFTGMFGPPPGR